MLQGLRFVGFGSAGAFVLASISLKGGLSTIGVICRRCRSCRRSRGRRGRSTATRWRSGTAFACGCGASTRRSAQRCERLEAGERWACGEAAGAALAALVDGRTVRCQPRERDRYGRLVAACSVDGRDLAGALAEGGWVFSFDRYARHYSADVATARAADRGIWGSRVEPPWEYRARERAGRVSG